jgi:hypothetical protein
MRNCRQLISAVVDGLNLKKWLSGLNLSRALRRLFSPALKILLKFLGMELLLITQVNHFNNVYIS